MHLARTLAGTCRREAQTPTCHLALLAPPLVRTLTVVQQQGQQLELLARAMALPDKGNSQAGSRCSSTLQRRAPMGLEVGLLAQGASEGPMASGRH